MMFEDLPTPLSEAATRAGRPACAYPRKPCRFFAARRCPRCALALCNNHTRTVTDMGRDPQAGLRRCSGCGFAGKDADYAALR